MFSDELVMILKTIIIHCKIELLIKKKQQTSIVII